LKSLLVRIGRLEELADLESTYIDRGGEHFRVNLKDYVSCGSDDDIELADGDILNIPKIDQFIVVGGEVQVPGRFLYQDDWAVARYIGLAGGPTENGSVDRVVIYSPDGSSRKAGKDAVPNRGDVIIVKKSKTKLFGEFFSGLIRLGTVVITIIVLTK
jgi:hypothetical protein